MRKKTKRKVSKNVIINWNKIQFFLDELQNGSKSEKKFYNQIMKYGEKLKHEYSKNPPIDKETIDRSPYKGVDRIYIFKLPQRWKLYYTFTEREIVIIKIINLRTHKEYCKDFGYKGFKSGCIFIPTNPYNQSHDRFWKR